MKLEINNFAKIKKAEIEIDGITVIAGENNTGKSTIGKIVFSMFNSLIDFKKKIQTQRERELEKIYDNIFQEYETDYFAYISENRKLARQVLQIFEENNNISQEEFDDFVDSIYKFNSESYFYQNNLNKILYLKTMEVIKLSIEEVTKEYISVYFNNVFHNQINSLNSIEQKALIGMKIKNFDVSIEFVKNNCTSFRSDINIIHKAIYIDNPFIIDKLSPFSVRTFNPTEDSITELLSRSQKMDILEGVIGNTLAKKKMEDLLLKLESIVSGEIIQSNSGFYLKKDGFNEPVHLSNLSAGLKSFTILKMLIEQGLIKEKDVIVLDEPEIHLHPQWQIIYAEIIVLLQKYFHLTIIVTTHSQYFLDAIDLFSKQHGVSKNVNFYLSELINDTVIMKNVNNNIDLIYKKMASPVDVLETLRYELSNRE